MTLATLMAIAASLLLTPLASALAWKYNAVSRPDGQRRLHARPTPLWGGSAIYLGLLLSIGVAYCLAADQFYFLSLPLGLALSAGILCLLGCYDDLYELGPRTKLAGHIVATLPILCAGGWAERLVLFGFPVELGIGGAVFAMVWLVLGMNALNLLDGMDGLASVVGIAIALAIAGIAAAEDHPAVMTLALALSGALGGFLVYNLPPAHIYLGDCGSTIIGATLALLALRVAMPDSRTAHLGIALALMFVPILDTALAVVRRTLTGRGWMTADRGHLHHRLLDRGFTVWQALSILGGFCLTTGLIAWGVAHYGYEALACGLLLALTATAVYARLFGREEWTIGRTLLGRFARRWLMRRGVSEPAALRVVGGDAEFVPDVRPNEEALPRPTRRAA